MLEIAVIILVVTALLAYLNRRILKLPMTIGAMAPSLAPSLGHVGLDAQCIAGELRTKEQGLLASIDLSWARACARPRARVRS